jgi:hypothetical protein
VGEFFAPSAILVRPHCRVDFGPDKDSDSANFLYRLVAESWVSVLPFQSVRGESYIFELWFRINRGCRVFVSRDGMSLKPVRSILCGLYRARMARCGTLKF